MNILAKSRGLLAVAALLIVAVLAWATPGIVRHYYHQGLRLVEVATGLEAPWAIAFLPDRSMLVTERPGRMRIVDPSGKVGPPLSGLPAVAAFGEGGLLDVVLSPDFATTRLIYWSFSEPAADDPLAASTAVARGRLEGQAVIGAEVIFRQMPKGKDGRHFGSRLLFTPEGHLIVGLGDRSVRDDAQNLASARGKILRLDAAGKAPTDNPFVGRSGALPEIWSYGHRNVQGLAYQPQIGSLWASEHGPNGGDEINLIRPGANYGWPVITYGCEYTTCAKIGEGTVKAGMVQPLTWFGPGSMPPTALAFITGDRYPEWKGQLLVGTLWGQALMRLQVDGDRVVGREPMWLGSYNRVRDVKQGPDGWIYVAVQNPQGSIVRLER